MEALDRHFVVASAPNYKVALSSEQSTLHPWWSSNARSHSFTTMTCLHIIVALLLSLRIPASSATRDTITAGQSLNIHDKLISKNGRYALGFFEMGSNSSQNTGNWYLGIWYHRVPKFTQAWVANRDDPMNNSASLDLKISYDVNLVILDQSTSSVMWSSQGNMKGTINNSSFTTENNTIAVLLNNGNFVLRSISNSSDILWQSFDHPTNTFFPGAKIGWDKVTGLNRRLVSRKNSISPASGMYHLEMDPSGLNQLILVALNSSVPYWSSGVWDGQYFALLAESLPQHANRSFVDNGQQKYYTYSIDESYVVYHHLDVSGQMMTLVWAEGLQDWSVVNAQPKARCDVYAACGPFTICNDDTLPHCTCMKGFTIKSPEDWVLDDYTGGCMRNTPLDSITNKSTPTSTDKFYPIPCVSLSKSSHKIEDAKTISDCGRICLNNYSCTAYSFNSSQCFIWHEELLNVRQVKCSSTRNSDGDILYLRLAAKDLQSSVKKGRGFVIGVAVGTSVTSLVFATMLIIIWRNRRKNSGHILNSAQGCDLITAFRYVDLQRATKDFSEMLGGGGFGSVFKGVLNDSITIAVKRLDHAYQGEKQFRAEVSSLGVIQHINLVKLVGFCCEGARRLLVYEYMPNRSLDILLFQSHGAALKWATRYQIALGVARGLAYLHESCIDCIIHCDIKPQNILLGDLFVPKIADFGMAKFLGRDFSRVITTMRGTIGYLAPEWLSGVAVTPKVDVYAYGMVLFEIISGKRNSSVACSLSSNHDFYYPVHAAQKIVEGDVNSLLDHRMYGDVNLKEVEIVCKIACWCIQDNELDRPTMGEVVQVLEGLLDISVPPMPRLLQAIAASSNSTCL
ncbi:hypothetical protein ACP4OV_009320 [Aristida adscensionis]